MKSSDKVDHSMKEMNKIYSANWNISPLARHLHSAKRERRMKFWAYKTMEYIQCKTDNSIICLHDENTNMQIKF